MSCREWKESWVAHLYGELDGQELLTLQAHLDGCLECTATLDALGRTRNRLRESPPDVPAAPRVIVVGSAPAWSASWGFAAGSLAALVVVGAGLWIARPPSPVQPSGQIVQDNRPPTDPPVGPTDRFAEQLAALDTRLDRVEAAPAVPGLTSAALRDELARFERRLSRERADELDYLLQSITASELRTGTWIDRTQDAIHLLAARQDPEVRDQ